MKKHVSPPRRPSKANSGDPEGGGGVGIEHFHLERRLVTERRSNLLVCCVKQLRGDIEGSWGGTLQCGKS